MSAQTPGRGGSVNVVDSQQPRPGPRFDQCIHELLAASCIWCTPRAGVVDVGEEDVVDGTRQPDSSARAASFFSRCPQCNEQITPGDTIYRSGTVYVCEGCA